ncbi:protein TPX2-like [Zingiber officinale]|uniref:protein TPX2-like n=1 Tax=Zingiber officinale TaxID=94328 RepID=UPI001C4B743E|nr:protein TPX2-like [Zingiber officinale]
MSIDEGRDALEESTDEGEVPDYKNNMFLKNLPVWPQNLAKPVVKEQTKPRNIRLHTEQRAAQRAGYNHLVASKINSLQILRRFEEKLLKHIEEEEIKSMRREMVPKAQLMPIFDKPFFPQRSTRPLTVPREPCFHLVKPSYSITSGQPYKLHFTSI